MKVRDLSRVETISKMRQIVLNDEENKVYSDSDLRRELQRLGVTMGYNFFIPRLRGYIPWDYIGLID